MITRPQRTLKKAVSFSGVGIHTGKEVQLCFCPAKPHSGIVFQRVDLPGKPTIPAAIEYVQDTARSTTIGIGSCSVQTVEHVLAALSAYQIDNLCIQITEGEPPIGDGSSQTFVDLIEEAGIEEQPATKTVIHLKHPVYFTAGQTHLIALPSDEFRISYTLHYPNTPVIRCQYLSLTITPKHFKEQIAPCRTFALYEEITNLMEYGLIRGGSLENAVVIKDNVIFSKEGLRFADEMVRHKILDLIGDLSLVGIPFLAHVIAIRAGHAANVELGKELVTHLTELTESTEKK
jgi:UDP-3-O-[3-hydroxymyristoyl] N-acetylglucosamine deacetylase